MLLRSVIGLDQFLMNEIDIISGMYSTGGARYTRASYLIVYVIRICV